MNQISAVFVGDNDHSYISDVDLAIVMSVDLHRHIVFNADLKNPVGMRDNAETYKYGLQE